MKPLKHIFFLAIALNCTFAFSQTRTEPRFLKNKLTAYINNFPREEIYVHTDRDRYVSGEMLWFRVYDVERLTLKPSSISRIAYVELLNYDNKPVVRKSIYLRNGNGPGEFTLPDTLSSGVYQLRAYTAWMKNFLPGNCFRKEIVIFNAVSPNQSFKKPLYAASVKKSAEQSNFPGFSVSINNSGVDNVEITIRTDNSFRASNNFSCNMMIETRGNITNAEEIRLAVDEVRHLVPKITLLPGVNHLAFITSNGITAAEKFIYIPGKQAADISIKTSDAFSKREKIQLDLQSSKEPVNGFSVSVSPLNSDRFPDMSSYLIFGSEYGDEILKQLKGRNPDNLRITYVDSILLNACSDYIDWNNIISDKLPSVKYRPETDVHYLTGKLINGGPEERVIMSVPGKSAYFQYSETDTNGNFLFELPVDGAIREIILEPDNVKTKGVVKLETSFSEDYLQAVHVSDSSEIDPGEMGINYQVKKIYGITDNEDWNEPLPQPPVVKRFYGKPDIGLILEDYIKLPTMDEIFFEIIPGTTLKQRRTGYEITVADPVTNLVYDHPPSLFIDGVRIDDAAQIANLDPESVEEIDVMRERYFVGDYMFTGIVNVITKAGDGGSVNLPDYAVKTFYRVIDPLKRFISPDYTAEKNQRIPDFRNTLWWNPAVSAKSPALFWSSDITGDYRITVNGITPDGKPISAEKIIRIK